MKHATLIDATDLDARADRLEGRTELPDMLRRLVVVTTTSATSVTFRTGEGIQFPGWDGRVEAESGTAWVPVGVSAWEAGVGSHQKAKADDDYSRRTKEPLDVVPRESTFIFVTMRRWSEKTTWASARRAEGKWRDVRAYDADDIEAWLESAPSVHVAFSRLLGKRRAATVDLEGWWEDWRTATSPALTDALLLAGRDKAVASLREWLGSPVTRPLAAQAESIEEAVAVLAASIMQFPIETRDRCFGRALVVKDRESWDQYAEVVGELVLVPLFSEDAQGAVALAVRRGKRVFVPLDRATAASSSVIQVPRLSWAQAKDALVAMGQPDSAARQLASLARRSLLGMRRKIGVQPELQQPAWAFAEVGRRFLPLVLAGSWSDTLAADQAALATLAGVPYAEIRDFAATWSNAEDPPIRKIGNSWVIASKEDAWPLLERFAVQDDYRRFTELTVATLSLPDPKYDLPPEKRLLAPVLGKMPLNSAELRDSLADSVAMLGARDADGAAWAAGTVCQLLEAANADWRVWSSLYPFLPRLAEGAPDSFLAAIEVALKSKPSPLAGLFEDRGDVTFSTSPHIGLLWALEVVAWNSDFVSRASLALASLCRIDPGGKTLNRPIGSLQKVFLPWFPQTGASASQRLQVLDRLRAKEPDVAWQLLCSLLPERASTMTFPSEHPRWRDWAPDEDPRIDASEYSQMVVGVSDRLLKDAGADAERWRDLVLKVDALPPQSFVALVARLREVDPEVFAPPAREQLWNALQDCVATHRNFSDADWAMPSDQVDRIEPLIPRFQPADEIARHAWMFDHMPSRLEGGVEDWDARQTALRVQRHVAVREIYEASGLDGLLALASRVPVPGLVGDAVGEQGFLDSAEEEKLLRSGLGAAEPSLANLVHGYSIGRQRGDCHWAERTLFAHTETLTATQRAAFLLSLPDDSTNWDRADACDEETRRRYWEGARPYAAARAEDCTRVVHALIKVGRTVAAIDLIAMRIHARDSITVSSDLVLEAVEAFKANPGKGPVNGMVGYHVRNLLDWLGRSGAVQEDHLATLEWAFLPILEHQGGPVFLYRELQRSPELFGLLLGFAYIGEGEAREDLTAEERARAERAYRVLDKFRVAPGVKPDGTLEEAVLVSWVKEVREAAARDGRGKMADILVGRILAGAPFGADGAFPHAAVREIIEDAESTDIERGFSMAIINGRGMTTRDPSSGGEQERQLVQKYTESANTIAAECPRTAAALRAVAALYSARAVQEDVEAERLHDRFS